MASEITDDSKLLARARFCDIAERYQDMATVMRQIMKNCHANGIEVTPQHRNLFSLAYKNLVSTRRSAWRVLFLEKQKIETNKPDELTIADEMLSQVEKELLELCDEVLDLIDTCALANMDPKNTEHNVFFLKMKGDYFRYKAEVLRGEDGNAASDAAQANYESAQKFADTLASTNPIRLGLYLNFSVFKYEILSNTEQACKIAQDAFNSAISDLDALSEDYYKDSTLIMQLLRDNLTLWSSKTELMANNNEDAQG